MNPDLEQPTFNDDDLSEATDAERQSARLAEEAAFAESFDDTAREVAQAPVASPAEAGAPAPKAAPAPAPKPAAAAPQAPTPAPAAPAPDPFAGVPEGVRVALAALPDLERQVKETKGRVGTLQRENEELKKRLDATHAAPAAAPAAPAAPAVASLETVRKELPEVATAIEDYVKDALGKTTPAAAAPAPASPSPPAQPAKTDEELALDAYDEKWADTLRSQDFKLYLTTLPEADRERITTTDKSAVIVGALTRFDRYRAQHAPAPPAPAASRRTERAAQAVQPKGSGAAPAPAQETQEDAFLAGFNDG